MDQTQSPSQPSSEWLTQAVEAWTREGLVRREQARWILARYGLADAETAASLKQLTFIQIITALGSLLVGVGVLLVVGMQWESIPRFARLALLVVATGGAYAAGYQMAYVRKRYIGVGKAFIFLGSLIWGSSIFLVGQMYHLNDSSTGGGAEYFTGLAWWFAGTLPLAYVLRSQLQLALSLVLGAVWLVGRWLDGINDSPARFLLTFVLFLAVGACLYVIGLLHRDEAEDESALAPAYQKFAVAFLTVALYALTYRQLWYIVGDRHWGYARQIVFAVPWAWLAPFISIAVLGAGWLLLRRGQRRGPVVESWICLGTAIVAGVLAWLVTDLAAAGMGAGLITTLALLFNLVLLAAEIGIIWVGWQTGQSGLVNWGLSVFMVHLMTRYFDLFHSMLNSGAGFIVAGALIIVSGVVLERQRQRLLHTMPGRQLA